jgi:hypothetical protein
VDVEVETGAGAVGPIGGKGVSEGCTVGARGVSTI